MRDDIVGQNGPSKQGQTIERPDGFSKRPPVEPLTEEDLCEETALQATSANDPAINKVGNSIEASMTSKANPQSGSDRPVERVKVVDQGADKTPIINDVRGALASKKEVFSYGGVTTVILEHESAILRCGRAPDAPPVMRAVPRRASKVNLVERMERAISWWKPTEGDQKSTLRQVRIPPWMLTHVAEMQGEGLPPLAGVVDYPVIWEGEVLAGPIGYHTETRLYIDSEPIDVDPEMYLSPQDAYAFLCEDWLSEARFETDADRIRALTLPLTLLLRRTTIRHGTPLYLFNAPEAKSGKTVTAEALVMAITGATPPATTYSTEREEVRKTLLAACLESPPIVLFDNMPNGWTWGDAALERYATADIYADRRLGASEQVEVPATAVIAATGNAIQPGRPDSTSRTLVCNFEGPEPGQVFQRNLLVYTQALRPQLLSAFLRIATAKVDGGVRIPGGRFSEWEKFVAQPMMIASETGVEVYDLWSSTTPTSMADEIMGELLESMHAKRQEYSEFFEGKGERGTDRRQLIFENGFSAGDMVTDFQSLLTELKGAKSRTDTVTDVQPRSVRGLLDPYKGRRLGEYKLRKGETKKARSGSPIPSFYAEKV